MLVFGQAPALGVCERCNASRILAASSRQNPVFFVNAATRRGMLSSVLRPVVKSSSPISSQPNARMNEKSELLLALQREIQRHDLSTFVDEPPSVAQGCRGVVVPGCPLCKKRFGTVGQYTDHLTKDILPAIINKLSADRTSTAKGLNARWFKRGTRPTSS
jgi:hypothetical protein